jgi:hypothetical protein
MWDRGMRHGTGKATLHKGSSRQNQYTGEWQNDLFHGQGLLTCKDGQKYDGEWQRGLRHGHGKFWFKNSSWCVRSSVRPSVCPSDTRSYTRPPNFLCNFLEHANDGHICQEYHRHLFACLFVCVSCVFSGMKGSGSTTTGTAEALSTSPTLWSSMGTGKTQCTRKGVRSSRVRGPGKLRARIIVNRMVFPVNTATHACRKSFGPLV